MDPSYRGRVPQVPYSNSSRGRGFRPSPRGLVIALVLAALATLGFVLLSQSGDKSVPLQQHLAARLITLQKITAEGEKNIKSSDLRSYNARLRIQIASDIASISDNLAASKTDPAIVANEADTASFDSLADAQLNNRFDDAYRKLLSQKLDSTNLLVKELHDATSSAKLKLALSSAYANFQLLESEITPVATN